MVVKQRMRKKSNPLKIITIAVAVLFITAFGALFITGYGDFSLNKVFDMLISGEETSEFANKTSVSVTVTALNDAAEYRITEELEFRLLSYFTLYYASLGALDTKDTKAGMDGLYSIASFARDYDGALLGYEITKRKNSDALLTYSECDIKITYKNANIVDGKVAEITLAESFSAEFDGFTSIKSSIAEREHFFTFYYNKGYGWQIERHEDMSSFGKYVFSIFAEENNKINKLINSLNASLIDYKSDFDNVPNKAEYAYDRVNAVKYALNNVAVTRNTRNKNFTAYSDNSMNYVSQCVLAGSIPMDAHGEGYRQWKWYSNELNHAQQSGDISARTGYSMSWIDGGSFYRYICENTGFGMTAGEISLFKAEKGDVIQFLDKTRENVIYNCIVTGKTGTELLLCGNSVDIKNMPISAVGFDEIRAIKIYGYNTTE